jgi:two-component system sensor histidine kinase TctE
VTAAPRDRRRSTPSLRIRLVAWLSGLCVAAAAALMLGSWLYGRNAADRVYDRILSASALAIAEQVYVRDGRLLVDLPYASLDMLDFAGDDRVFYRVIDPAGRTVTGYRDLPDPPAHRTGDETVFFDAAYRGSTVRFAALGRLVAEPGMAGWAVVQIGQTRNARAALAREMALSAAAPILLFMLVLVALVWIGVTRGLAPLSRIGRELSNRLPTDLEPVTVPAPREIVPMVEALNAFMGRLQRSHEQTRRFIADAAHQIRTPLASLHAQAELARDEVDPGRLMTALDRVASNARLTNRLTNQLLSNAMIAQRANLQRFEPVDLVEIARQAIHEAVPLSEGRAEDVTLDAGGLAAAPLQGDAIALREALRNLVENALHHGGAGAEVCVALRRVADRLECSVSDTGPGIPEHERERVLGRFERGSEATGPGSGLGLAIVRQVAEQHGADLALGDSATGGLRVSLRFHTNRAEE